MNRIEKIFPETLLQLMLDVLGKSPQFKYISGTQPFLMSFDNQEYNVYVKNLSSAYFKDRPDTTRAQLPNKDEFEEIKKSPNPFIFFGYDQENDVLVCWNFYIVKTRLNEKKSVSFYSRQFFQEEVSFGEFLRKKLKNGDEPILFKRKDLVEFFTKIDTFFTEEDEQELEESVLIPTNPHVSNGKILKIIEPDLIDQLRPIIETNHTFEAMKIAEKYYQGQYPAMKPKDWLTLVKEIDFNLVDIEENIDTETDIEIPSEPREELYKQQFIEFMQSQNKSEKTINRYVRVISAILTPLVKELYAPQLNSLFNTVDISLLNIWADQLLIRPDFLELNAINHRYYSCAFNKYIEFAESLSVSMVAEPVTAYAKSFESEFKAFMQNRHLSERTINGYIYVLSTQISKGIQKHIDIESPHILTTTNTSLLNFWYSRLFNIEEYIILDRNCKCKYSCAFKQYIDFAHTQNSSEQNNLSQQTPKTTELRFLQYLIDKGLSENSAKYYVNATGGKVGECIRTHINPELHSIYSETDYNTVQNWALALYRNDKFKELDSKGNRQYSCAIKHYVQFLKQNEETEAIEENEKASSGKKKTYILRVTYPNGRIVEERLVYKTLVDVVKAGGAGNVRNLGIMLNNSNLVSDTIIPRYANAQKPVGNGLYVMTCCDTATKQKIITQISEALSLNLTVERIPII